MTAGEKGDVETLKNLFCRKWMTYPELKRIERETGLKFKRGKFTKAETNLCMEAVESYLHHRGLDRSEFIDMMFVRNNEKGKLSSDLCRDFFISIAGKLEGRPVVNVYHFLRRRLHPSNKGEIWSADLDEELRTLHLMHGPQWEKIGREMGRFHVACRDRFRKIQAGFKRGPWTDEEVARLNEAYGKAERGEKPEGFATWTFISEYVGTRSPNQCQWKWTETVQFRTQHPDKRRVNWDPTDDRILVTCIYDMGVEHQSEICWSTLAASSASLSQFSSARLRQRWGILMKRVRGADAMAVDDLCEVLMRGLEPHSPELISDSDITDKES